MNRNQRLNLTLILGVIAVALVLVVVFVLNAEPGEDAEATDEAFAQEDPLFPDIGAEEVVTHVRVVDNETGEAIAATLGDEAQEWTIDEAPEDANTGLGTDADRILQAVFSLPTMRPSRVLTEIESLGTYGLEEAKYTIEFTTSGGESYSLNVGSSNPGGAAYYVRVPGSENVYLIPVYNLDPVINFIATPPFVQPTPDPNVTPTATESEG